MNTEIVKCATCAKQVSDGQFIELEHTGEMQCYACVQEDFEHHKALTAFDAELKSHNLALHTVYVN
jgi:hypothetical protein